MCSDMGGELMHEGVEKHVKAPVGIHSVAEEAEVCLSRRKSDAGMFLPSRRCNENFNCPRWQSTSSLIAAVYPHTRQLLRLFILTVSVHHVVG